MLQLRPNCELCDRDLPADSSEARICTYECTFCRDCFDSVLANICPNCGGGSTPRPIRPRNGQRPVTGLAFHPASNQRVHTPYSREQIRDFAAALRDIPPQARRRRRAA